MAGYSLSTSKDPWMQILLFESGAILLGIVFALFRVLRRNKRKKTNASG